MSNKKETKYNYAAFTKEDVKQYRDYLESMPYDPELNEFFHNQYLISVRQEHKVRKHIDAYQSTDCINAVSGDPDPEAQFFQNYDTMSLHKAMAKLSDINYRRLYAFFYEEKTLTTIAKQEGVSITAIHKSIAAALAFLKRNML